MVIDKFADEEIQQCGEHGLIPLSFEPRQTVGIRWYESAPKVEVVQDSVPPLNLESIDTGAFGRRLVTSAHRLVEDVLTVLRLLKPGYVRSPGSIVSFESWILGPAIHVRPRPSFRTDGHALNEQEIGEFKALWKTLTGKVLQQSPSLEIALRRFNFAFDRFNPEDRIVDLLIAAESLFLDDDKELRFKLALRASKFVKFQTERLVFRCMLDAYDVRSAVVHASKKSKKGKKNKTPLDKRDVSLQEFTDGVEEIIRRALCQMIELVAAGKGKEFGTSAFWEDRLFGVEKPAP